MKTFKFDNNLKEKIEKDYESCIDCRVCMRGCPMLDKFASGPKDLLEDLNRTQAFETDLPYSCMLCGYCSQVCPKDISFKDLFLDMRRLYVKENGGTIGKDLPASGVNFHQDFSFSRVFSKPIGHLESDICFFPGCAFLADNPIQVGDVYSYLQSIYPGIGFWNTCCGNPTKSLGRQDKFQERMEGFKAEYRAKGIKRIVTACQNCTLTIEEACSDLEVIPIYNILAENFPEEEENRFKDLGLTVSIHDPCPSRSYPDLQDNIRTIVGRLGFEIEELKYSKNRTICCSAGGMVKQTAPEIAKIHADRRAGEGDKALVTYCKECERTLGLQRDIDHILDLVFLDESCLFEKHKASVLGDWINRFIGRSLAK